MSVNSKIEQTVCSSSNDLYMKSVLVVDDNPYVRAGLRHLLEKDAELQVCGEAANGVEAIRKAVEQRPSLIVMDLSMPYLNGVAAASKIRKLLPDARIVVFTLFSDEFGKAMERVIGVDLVVSKTDGVTGLMDKLRKFLASSSPQTEKITN